MSASHYHARGNTLFIVVVLLLLVSMMSLYALNTGVFEQRISGNDVRTKLVNEVAEAGIAHGMEFMRENAGELADVTSGRWVQCGADETAFPCGSIVPESDVTTAAGTVTVPRRETMYYWDSGEDGFDFNDDGEVSGWEQRMLPLDPVVAETNGFESRYGVGVVLCRVAFKTNASDPTVCTDNPELASPSSVITLVSVGSLTSEGARATVVQTFGTYNLLSNPPGKPPIMASGSVDLTGNLQVVTNPNGGGTGVPVSVWTRKDMTKHGTPNTCYMDEFIRYAKANASPAFEGESKVLTCDTCECDTEHTLSYQSSGPLQQEGIDILDREATGNEGANRNVEPEEFPCDMFENVFGVKAWEDRDDPPDFFCETKLMASYKTPRTGVVVSLPADEVFLYTNAARVIPRDDTAKGLLKSGQELLATNFPAATLSGLIWCQKDCTIGSNEVLGSPDRPVLLVADGALHIQGRIFGMVFLRATEDTLDPATGGTATLDMNAGAAVYGSIIVQGQVDKANGTAAVVYNSQVLTNLANDPGMIRFGGIPGGWADTRVSY